MDNLNVEIRCALCGKLIGHSDREQVAYCADHDMSEINPTTWDDIRHQRDELLTSCDWTQLPDASLSAEEKAVWATYRQSLRDLPQNYSTPIDVIWPEVT